jgi:hypothetical protein
VYYRFGGAKSKDICHVREYIDQQLNNAKQEQSEST